MSNLVRRGLIVLGIAAVALIAYQVFFHFWPHHPAWGWSFRYWGLRAFPGFPLLGFLIMVALGFAMVKIISQVFSSRSGSQKIEWTYCPFCGRDLRWAESKSPTIDQPPSKT